MQCSTVEISADQGIAVQYTLTELILFIFKMLLITCSLFLQLKKCDSLVIIHLFCRRRTDHSKCHSTSRQNQPIEKKILNQSLHFAIPQNLECPELVLHSLYYDWMHHLQPFGLGIAVKPWEEEED